jgi:hypothetical protein
MTEQLTEHGAAQAEAQPAAPAMVRVSWAPVARVNLLPIEIIETRRFGHTQRWLGAAVLTTIILGGCGVFLAQRSVDEANDEQIASEAKVLTLQREKTRYADVPKVIAQVDAAVAARSQAMGTDVLWYRYLREIDDATPAGVTLKSLSMGIAAASGGTEGGDPLSKAGPGTFAVEATAKKYGQVANWLEAVDKITGLASASLGEASKNEDTINFSSRAVITVDALSGRYDKKAG